MTALPVVEDGWLRPADTYPAEPRWGHPSGMQVGLHPLRGPRGLVRVYTPYLDQPRDRLLNFLAVEPVPAGEKARGYSELEASALDGVQGKRFWSSDHAADPTDVVPGDPERPARGVVETVDGVEHLRVHVLVEPFDNGADVYLRLSFRADRPHEVAVAAYRRETSVDLDACIVTATMGNFARLRRLHLAGRVVTPAQLWPDFTGHHFAEHATFGLPELLRGEHGEAVVHATGDEPDPASATYADDVRPSWHYVGRPAVQTWRAADPDPAITVSVNARRSYWASTSEIPGGASYENVELVEPFRQGRELVFSVEPLEPGWDPERVG